MCINIDWQNTSFPNLRDHDTQAEANNELTGFYPLVLSKCSNALVHFLCSVYTPACFQYPDGTYHILKPCRNICTYVRQSCEPLMRGYGYSWPTPLECTNFPIANTSELCLNITNLYSIQFPAIPDLSIGLTELQITASKTMFVAQPTTTMADAVTTSVISSFHITPTITNYVISTTNLNSELFNNEITASHMKSDSSFELLSTSQLFITGSETLYNFPTPSIIVPDEVSTVIIPVTSLITTHDIVDISLNIYSTTSNTRDMEGYSFNTSSNIVGDKIFSDLITSHSSETVSSSYLMSTFQSDVSDINTVPSVTLQTSVDSSSIVIIYSSSIASLLLIIIIVTIITIIILTYKLKQPKVVDLHEDSSNQTSNVKETVLYKGNEDVCIQIN